MEAFPCLDGTRDGKLVKIVRQRLEQFDLLLGGISQPVKEPPPGSELEKQDRALPGSAGAHEKGEPRSYVAKADRSGFRGL